MPGMPIFQDSPSQLKGQIYVLDSTTSNVVPLEVDAAGNLPITGSVTFEAGAEVSLAAGTTVGLEAGTDINTVTEVTTVGTVSNDVKIVNGSTALTVGLEAGTDIDTVTEVTTVGTVTNDVKIVNGSTALTVGLEAGTDIDTVTEVTTVSTVTNDVKIVNGSTELTVELSAGSNLIGKVENQLVFTNLDSFGAATPLTSNTIDAGLTVNSSTQDISQQSSYNWFIKNTGTTADQDITLKVELSPDGTNWLEDTGTTISVPFGTSKMITVTNFLQFARFVITGGTSDTTVISSYQAQH
ncbi:DUF6385 domain-containing protein [Clostridium aminobutyricum]|uniref:DUF6385 domain-containing protein n=1 Tax=Clostridium aminobutyricum TaxID=33953 RepID=A0A939IHE1_CLOAM|nr:DUF6385 domain-containing protein [Clostridium aminobutyricum]MBN7771821.1 hypothetical protein [Clostridium aminobutyricum]